MKVIMPFNVESLEVESALRRFITDNYLFGEDATTLNPNASLLESGILDSTAVVELVCFLEESFAIQVADEELLPENLDTISRIVQYVGRKQKAGVESNELAYAH
jgi:acyl carrier protein